MLPDMAGADEPVIGASGFLGSHVTRQLVERGDSVRVMLRESSPTRGIEGLPVQRHYGDIDHSKAVRELGWRPRDVHQSITQAAEFFIRRSRERKR